MTKKQKVTITIVGPLVLCLSLVLIFVWPFLTTRRDTDPQKSASGQSPIVAQAIVAASVGQAVVAQSSPGSPAVLPVSTLLPIIPGSTGFGSQCWNSTCGIFNCPTPGGTPIALGSPPQFNPTTGVNLNTFTSPSFVENQTMNYHHIAVDYSAAGGSASGGCAPCGNSGAPNNGANLPTLEIGRRHRYRDMTEVSSFGPGVFLNYDIKLHFSYGTAEIFDPQSTFPRYLSDSGSPGLYDHWFGSAGIGDGAELGCSIQLQDSTGTPVSSLNSTARAVLTNRLKNTFTFGVFETSPGSGTYGGRLTEIADPNGRGLTLAYKTWTQQEITQSPARQWQIDTVTDAYGRSLTFTYAAQQVSGRWVVDSILLPDGTSTITYAYANDALSTITYPDANQSTFAQSTEPISQCTIVDMTDLGTEGSPKKKVYLAADTMDGGGSYVWSSSSLLCRLIENGDGEVLFFNIAGLGASWVYEGQGRLMYRDDVYRAKYYPEWTLIENNGQTMFSGTAEATFAGWAFPDGMSPFEGSMVRPGTVTDERGVTRSFTYADNFQIESVAYPDDSWEEYSYNSLNQVTRHKDREHHVTKYTYDARGNMLTKEVGILADPNSLGGGDPTGWLPNVAYSVGVRVLDGMGFEFECIAAHTSDYDSEPNMGMDWSSYWMDTMMGGMGDPVGEEGPPLTDPAADTQTSAYALYQWQYFSTGHANEFMLSAEIDANGNQTDYEYNANDQITKIIQPADAPGAPRAETVYSYDALGRLASETDPMGRVTSYEYDWKDRLVKTIHNDGSTERTIYGSGLDANLVYRQKDRNGVVTEYDYDNSGRRTKTIIAAGTMDLNDNFTAITDSMVRVEEICTYIPGEETRASCVRAGDRTDFTYDYRGRVASTTVYPRIGVTLTSSQAYLGNQLFYQEDPYGRRTYYAYRTSDGGLIRRVQGTVPDFEAAASGGGSGGGGSGGGGGSSGGGGATAYNSGYDDGYYAGYDDGWMMMYDGTTSNPDPDYVAGYQAGYGDGYGDGDEDTMMMNPYGTSLGNSYGSSSNPPSGGGSGGGGSPPPSSGPFTSFAQVLALTRGVDPEPNGSYIITDYVLDDAGNTIETIDGRGISQTVAYDSRDRAIEQVQAAGTAVAAKTETVYDANGNVTEVRSPRYFDANDSNGYQKAKTTMTYGGRNRVASRTEAPGTAEAGTESYTYTVDGRLDTHTDARGNDWQTIYHACCGRTQATIDPLGHGTITNNDYRGNVTHQATVSEVASHTNYHDPDDTKTLGEVTTRYDERHRPIARTTWLVPLAVVDPNNVPIAGSGGIPAANGLTQRWFHDDDLDDGQGLDAGISVAKIDGSGSFTLNIASLITELSADGTALGVNSDGSATVTLNGEDEISVSISDGTGRSVAQGILEQTGTAITWSTVKHDAVVNIANFGDVLETARHDALNHITRSRADGAGRTIESVDAETFVSTFSSDANGNQVSVRDPNSVGQNCTFDALNRDVSCTDTQGDATSKAYDLASNIIKTIDAKSAETLCSFDARNRQVQCTNRIGSVTQWGYDANGNLLSLLDGDNHDANGDATLYTYDARNLKTSEAFPGHGPTSSIGDADYDLVSFTYDAARRIAVKTDQQGDTATHNYDLAGRLTSRAYQGGPLSPLAGQSDTDTFAYDAAGRMTSATSGRYNNVVAMGYDNASRLVSESLTAYGQTYTVGSGFDAANRKTSITYPDSTVVNRGYTDRDQLSQITYDGSVVDTRTYDNGGRLATSEYGNGIGTTWSYRNDNLVSSITRTNLTGADFTYTYDANKNKTSEAISGVMAPYGFNSTGYDQQDRLTAWNRTDGALNQSWNLSKEGDWDSFTENAVVQNRTHSPVHELSTLDSQPLTYDSKGNLTQNSNGQTYTWDFDNRMVSATVPIGATEGIEGTHGYTYDALGRRVSKSIHDGGNVDTTIFVTSGDQGVGEYAADESTGAVSKQYLYGSYIDELVATMQTPSGNRHYYHHNSLFTVSALTDTSGAVTERYAFDPYGSLLFLDASGSLTPTQASSAGNPYGFTGRVRDLETRLWYFRARYVDSRVGRFISRDPLMYGDGANLYQYAQSAPLHSLDPSGLATCTKWVKKSRPCTKLDDQMCNLSCTAQGHVSGKMTVCYTYVRTCTSWCWGTYLEEKSGGNCQCTTNVWVCVCPPPPKGCTLLGNTNTQNKKIPSGPCLCAYSCIGQSGKPYFTPPKPGTWTLNGTTTL